MDLKTFIADKARSDALAARCGTSRDYLWQLAVGWRGKRASVEMAMRIERESAALGPEKVPKETLRPDVWAADEPAPQPAPQAPEPAETQIVPVERAA